MDVDAVTAALHAQVVETPSWAYGNSGTRFAVFAQPGVPRDPFEKLEDAAEVHRHTGIAPSVALHIPWDRVDDFAALREHADELGLRLGAINPNLFQEPEYKLGSVCHPHEAVRRQAVAHVVECIEIATETGSDVVSLWLADGTNYAGQDSFAARRARLVESLLGDRTPCSRKASSCSSSTSPPSRRSTRPTSPTGVRRSCFARRSAPRPKVLVDLGHHAHGVNIEQIVSLLAREGRLGGFHFNDRKYGDDDLIAGAVDPFQLFLIFHELVACAAFESGVRLTIDQSHNVEPKIEAMIQTVENLQDAYAKALIIDRGELERAHAEGDVLAGHRALVDAFRTDVRPLSAKVRRELGASEDPVAAFRSSGYTEAQGRRSPLDLSGKAASWT